MARKVAFALRLNVEALVKEFGVERIGFLTLTFPDHVTDPKECNRRFDNLRRRVLRRYSKWIAVRERQKSGRLHLHLLVAVAEDIQTGVNFAEIKRGNYRSAGRQLRAEWLHLRSVSKKYSFGRTELLPIKSNAEGVSRYVGKYIQKNLDCRTPADKGARLVSYSKGGGQVKANGFAWNSPQMEGHCVPATAMDIRVASSGFSEDYWAENLDEWLALCQKEMAFARMKRDREFFNGQTRL